MFQGTEAGDAVYWDVETQEEFNGVRAMFIAKSMQKEVFGLLSVIRLLVKWAEVDVIDLTVHFYCLTNMGKVMSGNFGLVIMDV